MRAMGVIGGGGWWVVAVALAFTACQQPESKAAAGKSNVAPAEAAASATGADAAPAPIDVPEDPARVVQLTHDFFRELDANDSARIGQMLADRFAFADGFYLTPREQLLRSVTAREHEKYPVILGRSWSGETVRFFGATAVYTGFSSTSLLRDEGAAQATVERFVTQVWVWQAARWQLAHWQDQEAGVDADRQMWNQFFRTSKDFNLKPNQLLVESVRGRRRGAALDVGMGQGRNALYLASQGWKVTGVDISDEGLRQARAAATRQGLKLETIEADIDTWDLGTNRWDLIAFIYTGGIDAPTVARVEKAIRKGGLVVVEYVPHGGSVVGRSGGKNATDAPVASLFAKAGWKVLRDEEVEDQPDFGKARALVRRFVAERL
jgi:SAM-dependent methyltransferase